MYLLSIGVILTSAVWFALEVSRSTRASRPSMLGAAALCALGFGLLTLGTLDDGSPRTFVVGVFLATSVIFLLAEWRARSSDKQQSLDR